MTIFLHLSGFLGSLFCNWSTSVRFIRVARCYLIEQKNSMAVVSNHEHEKECIELGLDIINLA